MAEIETGTPLFTPVQRRLIAFTLALTAFVFAGVLLVGMVLVCGRLLGVFSHVIWPLATAGIMAMILRPVVGVLEHRLRFSRTAAILVLYGLVVIAFTGFLLLFMPELIRQVVDFVNAIPELWQRAATALQEAYPKWSDLYTRAMANDTLRKIVEGLTEQVQLLAAAVLPNLKAAGGTVLGVAGFVTSLAIIPVYLFFFLQSNEDPTRRLHDYLPFLKSTTRDDVVFLIREFIGIVVAFFRGQLLIGLIMGVLLATGFTISGLQFGVVLGLTVGLLNVIPYLGTILGLSVVIPLAYFQPEGGALTVGLCLGVFAAVQVVEGYVLTPRIMGRQTGLHPVAIIIAIFFWGTALNGILGMILAIPLTAFLVTAWRLAKRKYFAPVV